MHEVVELLDRELDYSRVFKARATSSWELTIAGLLDKGLRNARDGSGKRIGKLMDGIDLKSCRVNTTSETHSKKNLRLEAQANECFLARPKQITVL